MRLFLRAMSATHRLSTLSGGTFSDPSLLGHLSAGANVKVKLLKDYEGPGLGIFYGKNGSRATVEIDLNQHAWNLYQ